MTHLMHYNRANSGIGEALALYYAKNKPGVHLVLTGRNTERLANIKSECGI